MGGIRRCSVCVQGWCRVEQNANKLCRLKKLCGMFLVYQKGNFNQRQREAIREG